MGADKTLEGLCFHLDWCIAQVPPDESIYTVCFSGDIIYVVIPLHIC